MRHSASMSEQGYYRTYVSGQTVPTKYLLRREVTLIKCGMLVASVTVRMSGQFLFYQENEAINRDKCSDDEPPCWNVPGWQRHCDENVHRNSVRKIISSIIKCGVLVASVTVRMSGQFLFYQENEAINRDECSDDEPPCWNVPGWQRHCDENVHRNSVRIIGQYDATITIGSCIDDVTVTHLFSFGIVSGETRNERYDFRLFKVTRKFFKFHCRMIPWSRELFGKWRHNSLVTSDVHDGE